MKTRFNVFAILAGALLAINIFTGCKTSSNPSSEDDGDNTVFRLSVNMGGAVAKEKLSFHPDQTVEYTSERYKGSDVDTFKLTGTYEGDASKDGTFELSDIKTDGLPHQGIFAPSEPYNAKVESARAVISGERCFFKITYRIDSISSMSIESKLEK